MLQNVQDYRNGIIPYKEMVSKLEGSFEASELKDENITKSWYDYWTPLEIESATGRMDNNMNLVVKCLDDMTLFIKSVLAGSSANKTTEARLE